MHISDDIDDGIAPQLPPVRVGCGWCLSTLNPITDSGGFRQCSQCGRCFHSVCWEGKCTNICCESNETRPFDIASVPEIDLERVFLPALHWGLTNQITDKPMGVSDTVVAVSDSRMCRLRVCNNSQTEHKVTAENLPPWIHASWHSDDWQDPSIARFREVLHPCKTSELRLHLAFPWPCGHVFTAILGESSRIEIRTPHPPLPEFWSVMYGVAVGLVAVTHFLLVLSFSIFSSLPKSTWLTGVVFCLLIVVAVREGAVRRLHHHFSQVGSSSGGFPKAIQNFARHVARILATNHEPPNSNPLRKATTLATGLIVVPSAIVGRISIGIAVWLRSAGYGFAAFCLVMIYVAIVAAIVFWLIGAILPPATFDEDAGRTEVTK